MISDMNKRLEAIEKRLRKFGGVKEKIKGNAVPRWFYEGECIFKEFYYLGASVKWELSKIDGQQSQVLEIISLVTEKQDRLQSFIAIYPGLRIDLDGGTPAVLVCQVRSGIQFLLKAFKQINEDFDRVLKNLVDLGELDEFDDCLSIWVAGHRPDFFPGDLPDDTPKHLWWWF